MPSYRRGTLRPAEMRSHHFILSCDGSMPVMHRLPGPKDILEGAGLQLKLCRHHFICGMCGHSGLGRIYLIS